MKWQELQKFKNSPKIFKNLIEEKLKNLKQFKKYQENLRKFNKI